MTAPVDKATSLAFSNRGGSPLVSRVVSVVELTALFGAERTPAMSESRIDAETTRLAALARAGDRDAFSALIDLHHRAARRVALAALPSVAEADEAVQDACLTAWRSLDRLDDPAAFRAWLLRIAWRKALDRRRSVAAWLRRFRQDAGEPADEPMVNRLAAPGATPADALLADERDRVVAQVIRSLPPRLRDPFLLAATGEHRYEDIAGLLDIPLGTVKWRMAEARRVLREKLTRLGFGAPS
jgi:RNA polymerase sigma-70 factor (ECF subfamily)